MKNLETQECLALFFEDLKTKAATEGDFSKYDWLDTLGAQIYKALKQEGLTYMDGYNAGHEDAEDAACDDSWQDGYEVGKNSGYEEGNADGYDVGYADGYEVGYNEGSGSYV